MRTIIGTTAAIAALGLAVSAIPAAAQHHGGPGGHAMGGAPSMGRGMGAAPSMGASPHFSGPSTSGFASAPHNFSPNRGNFASPNRGNFAPSRGIGPNNGMAWNNRRGDRGHDFDRGRRFRPGLAFGLGFGGYYGDDYAYDYGPDYAYDNGYDNGYGYGDSCYAVRRVYGGGYWHVRRVWICG
jgi:hypothetical protein